MNRHAVDAGSRPQKRPSNLFYLTRLRRPLIDRAEGIYIWDVDGRRYIDGSSGPVAVNIGHGNRNVLDAMKRQMDKATFAYRLHFENEPAEELARALAGRMPGGLDRIFFVSGGSEAVESCIKLARQWAVATGQPKRWKVISRMPSYHGGTFGALAVTGDGMLTDTFADQMRMMPTVPAPTAYRDRDNLTMDERGLKYADMLEEKILAEGPDSVARLHHGADRRRGDQRAGGAGQLLSAHPRDLRPLRHPAHPRRGHERRRRAPANSWAATTGTAGPTSSRCRRASARATRRSAPWRRRSHRQAGARHGRLPAWPHLCRQSARLRGGPGRARRDRPARPDRERGRHGRGADGRDCAAWRSASPSSATCAARGCCTALEFVADPVDHGKPLPPEVKIGQRVLDLAYERGLIVYSRRVSRRRRRATASWSARR